MLSLLMPSFPSPCFLPPCPCLPDCCLLPLPHVPAPSSSLGLPDALMLCNLPSSLLPLLSLSHFDHPRSQCWEDTFNVCHCFFSLSLHCVSPFLFCCPSYWISPSPFPFLTSWSVSHTALLTAYVCILIYRLIWKIIYYEIFQLLKELKMM